MNDENQTKAHFVWCGRIYTVDGKWHLAANIMQTNRKYYCYNNHNISTSLIPISFRSRLAIFKLIAYSKVIIFWKALKITSENERMCNIFKFNKRKKFMILYSVFYENIKFRLSAFCFCWIERIKFIERFFHSQSKYDTILYFHFSLSSSWLQTFTHTKSPFYTILTFSSWKCFSTRATVGA